MTAYVKMSALRAEDVDKFVDGDELVFIRRQFLERHSFKYVMYLTKHLRTGDEIKVAAVEQMKLAAEEYGVEIQFDASYGGFYHHVSHNDKVR